MRRPIGNPADLILFRACDIDPSFATARHLPLALKPADTTLSVDRGLPAPVPRSPADSATSPVGTCPIAASPEFVTLHSPRVLEIFLHAMLAYGATSNSYLLAGGCESALDDADLEVRRALEAMFATVTTEGRASRSWPAVAKVLDNLGYGGWAPKRPWGELPDGLE